MDCCRNSWINYERLVRSLADGSDDCSHIDAWRGCDRGSQYRIACIICGERRRYNTYHCQGRREKHSSHRSPLVVDTESSFRQTNIERTHVGQIARSNSQPARADIARARHSRQLISVLCRHIAIYVREGDVSHITGRSAANAEPGRSCAQQHGRLLRGNLHQHHRGRRHHPGCSLQQFRRLPVLLDIHHQCCKTSEAWTVFSTGYTLAVRGP
jgi:hypothetical protein